MILEIEVLWRVVFYSLEMSYNFDIVWLCGSGIRTENAFHFLGACHILETYHELSHLILMGIPEGG